ncbi:hypothetical protein [Ammoniphilus sp. CFH 90114]|uniref:hypothetical protein n=1 Tax=Ammoniphilus sp. CFH 90114 TaxID=2493665 RepID=UPI00100F8BDB|nr:hypothetical protein [Ammoniphilus sp. CFH 90114]RXT02770.1 hypothetical protein EIZ39_24560 [Ammoniphilus sp. CFH 90114]
MTLKQEGYTFNIYDPIVMQIKTFSKKITHYGNLSPFVVNINDNVDVMTKSGIDEFILFFEKHHYYSPVQCCLLAAIPQHVEEVSLGDLALSHQLFGYLAFGLYKKRKVNTASVLQYLTSKEEFPFKRIYRVNDHSIIHPSELPIYQNKFKQDPEKSRHFFYLCRCLHFNHLRKKSIIKGKEQTIPLVSSYFQQFLSILMKNEEVGYEITDKDLRSIGALEFEISNLAELDSISQLIQKVLKSEEWGW